MTSAEQQRQLDRIREIRHKLDKLEDKVYRHNADGAYFAAEAAQKYLREIKSDMRRESDLL